MKNVKTCFWCMRSWDDGKEIDFENEIPLFTTYGPCKKCNKVFSAGVHIIGVQPEQMMKNQPPIGLDKQGKPLYPSGNTFAAPEEWVREFLREPEDEATLEKVLEQKVMLLPSAVVDTLIEQIKEMDNDNSKEMVSKEMADKQQKFGIIETQN